MCSRKLALVTGAAGGIGKATCELFAKSGIRIAAADSNLSAARKLVTTLEGDDHLPFRVDVNDSHDVEGLFANIKSIFHVPPNIIVNAAGIIKDNFLLNLPEDDFRQVINVNLVGTFLVSKKACEFLVDAGIPGSIVNIASIVGKRGNLGQCNYAASKAGIESFSKCVAMEMAKYGIRCNTILPGFISTPMTEGVPDKVKEQIKTLIPLKRFGNPEEVAELIKFLTSDSSSYITGTSINVSGGLE